MAGQAVEVGAPELQALGQMVEAEAPQHLAAGRTVEADALTHKCLCWVNPNESQSA